MTFLEGVWHPADMDYTVWLMIVPTGGVFLRYHEGPVTHTPMAHADAQVLLNDVMERRRVRDHEKWQRENEERGKAAISERQHREATRGWISWLWK